MNWHKIICGSLASACAAGAIAQLAYARPAIEPPHMFFAGLTLMLAFLLAWMGWWDDVVNDNAEPSRIERAAARTWLWTRRILCWGAALVFWGFAATILAEGFETGHLPVFLILAALGAIAIWVGLKGAGHSQGMGDDVAVHAERRKRYGWWL